MKPLEQSGGFIFFMGVEEDIKKRALRIKELLLGSSLKEALEQIQAQMAGVSDWSISS